MNLEQYQRLQRQNSTEFVQVLGPVIEMLLDDEVSNYQWLQVLQLIYPYVEQARYESARIAREFYDAQRALHVGNAFPVFLARYTFEWFVQDMNKIRGEIINRPLRPQDRAQVMLNLTRSVENGGRRTIIGAVDDDREGTRLVDTNPEQDFIDAVQEVVGGQPPPKEPGKQVKGWARIPQGVYTCAWCIMLCSRGPVYESRQSAGGMEEWHPGCDCDVVPVFDQSNWEGREFYLDAYEAWLEVTADYDGDDKMRAFRRAYDSGKINLRFPLSNAA